VQGREMVETRRVKSDEVRSCQGRAGQSRAGSLCIGTTLLLYMAPRLLLCRWKSTAGLRWVGWMRCLDGWLAGSADVLTT
jgi:hypothetical protein